MVRSSAIGVNSLRRLACDCPSLTVGVLFSPPYLSNRTLTVREPTDRLHLRHYGRLESVPSRRSDPVANSGVSASGDRSPRTYLRDAHTPAGQEADRSGFPSQSWLFRSSAAAGPVGFRRSCSQFWSVLTLTPMKPAKSFTTSCARGSPERQWNRS